MTYEEFLSYPMFIKGLQLLVAATLISLIVRFVRAAATKKIDDRDARYRVRKATEFVGYVIFFIMAASIFSKQMGNVTIILGALGVGVGIAMREVIQSLAGWVAVMFGGLYKPGERIQIGGVLGDVIDVGLLYTTVMECGGWVKADLYNGRLVRLSNSVIFQDPVINYTSDFPFLWDEIVIPVRTVSDHRLARQIIERVGTTITTEASLASQKIWADFVRRFRVEDARLDPFVTMTFDSNYMEFTLRYIVDYRFRRSTKDKLFSAILQEIEATNGKVEIGSTTMELTELPLSVRPESPLLVRVGR